MAEFIVMPKLGFDMREGVLNRWLKEIGEPVKKGEVVAEIESDKATLDLEAQVEGTLLAILEDAGAIVPIGANLAVVGEEGEDVSELTADTPTKPAASDKADKAEATETDSAETTSPSAPTPPSGEAVSDEFPDGVKATPVARRVAEEKKVDLRQVNGSGPGGRIRKADVEAYLEAGPAPTTTPVSKTAVPTGPDTTEIPLTRLRQAIARRMVESKTTVPQFYVTASVNMDAAFALRKQINAALPDGEKVTVNDLVVKAAALALREFPNINASFAGDKLIRHNRIHIGSAVAVEGGLLTIVQRDTDATPLAQIARDNRDMVARARSGKVKPEDVEGSTFTISNLGAFDVDHFIAIINPPEAAILAVGSALDVPMVVNRELTIGKQMKATISADHRVTDGAEAAQFLQRFKQIMEEPINLLL